MIDCTLVPARESTAEEVAWVIAHAPDADAVVRIDIEITGCTPCMRIYERVVPGSNAPRVVPIMLPVPDSIRAQFTTGK